MKRKRISEEKSLDLDRCKTLDVVTPISFDTLPQQVTEQLAHEILFQLEGFDKIDKAPDIKGIPFNYLGLRSGDHYLIAIRDIVIKAREPSDTLKGRITKLLKDLPGLKAMHIQVLPAKSCYCIYHTDFLLAKDRAFVSTWGDDLAASVESRELDKTTHG